MRSGETVVIKMTILPLRSGTLVLDGFKLRLSERSESELLSLAHSFQIHVYDKILN